MRHPILTFLFTIIYCALSGQGNDTWTAFWNKDTTLVGFKDKNGTIKIQPRFKGFTDGARFENIIAVTEEVNGSRENYYLTKSGKIVGRDSLHMFDNGSDCESEGFIRFKDNKTDKVGMFNRNGDIALPAAYDDLTRVRNGMIIALKGATKKRRGEHYSWIGGKEMLIDTNNNILVDTFRYHDNLNFFSLIVSAQPGTDTIRQSFQTTGGQYFSFINFEKEFKAWLTSSLLKNLTKSNLLNQTYKEVTYWKEPGGWTREAKSSFMNKNFDLIKAKLLQLKLKNCDYYIFDDGLDPYTYKPGEYKDFFDDFGQSKDWIYPIKDVVINYNDKKNLIQDHFEFLRTDNGYKLLSVTIRKGKLQ